MSFILDALKKSESERQRNTTPGFADIPDARDRSRPQRWLWIIGTLLAINLAVLAGILLLPASGPDERVASELEVQAEPPAPDAEQAFAELVAEARRNRPATDAPTTSEPQREEQPASTVEPQPATEAAAAPEPAEQRTITESQATFDDLRADGTLQLPDLHLDVHVYSEEAAERFVFINMSKYKERANLAEGPLVKEITPDGVILQQAGTEFLLPRR